MERRGIVFGAAAVLAAGLLPVIGAGTAGAHQTCQNYGANWGCVSSDHRTISAHDVDCDNNFVWAEYVNGAGNWSSVTDANGCAAGGDYKFVSSGVVQYRICEGNVGCTGFKYT